MAEKQNLRKIKELVDLMVDNGLVELEIVDGDSKIHLKRPGSEIATVTHLPISPSVMPAGTHPAPTSQSPDMPQQDNEEFTNIESPIIGTFYSAPSPDSAPFIAVGDRVNPDTVVCIIEAMKVMNEIKAETSGTVVELVCKPGQAVEFGQPLFKLKPD
jgi:acetyl-CoA carboxylase biotin carboxyl carrier protein